MSPRARKLKMKAFSKIIENIKQKPVVKLSALDAPTTKETLTFTTDDEIPISSGSVN